jgi:hypothetical protein
LDDNGPVLYLADVHDQPSGPVLHWKYNIAQSAYTTVRVLDGAGQEVAIVSRPTRQVAIAGRTGPFSLEPRRADGTAGEAATVEVGVPLPAVPAISRIGIRQVDGRAEFVQLATGVTFNPAGMNYIPLRNGDHATFDAATRLTEAFYDPLEAEATLRLLRRTGYNTVRVFLAGRSKENPGLAGEATTLGVYTPYLDNVADFLRRAAFHGIHVIFNFCDIDLPNNGYFRQRAEGRWGYGVNVLSPGGLAAYCEMVASTLDYLKKKNPDLLKIVLGVQFNNEISTKLKAWPFSEKGPVTLANGQTYDMTRLDHRARAYEEGLTYFYQQVCAVVKSIDPNLLTTEGLFVAGAVGRDHREGERAFETSNLKKGFGWEEGICRLPPPLRILARSPLDFVDIHLYPEKARKDFPAEIDNLLETSLFREAVGLGLISQKPVILGEFGGFKKHLNMPGAPGLAEAVKRWEEIRRIALERGMVGYLGWSLETFLQTDIYQAMAMGPTFLADYRAGDPFLKTPAPVPPATHSATAANPITLLKVAPTGADQGYLVPWKLSPPR